MGPFCPTHPVGFLRVCGPSGAPSEASVLYSTNAFRATIEVTKGTISVSMVAISQSIEGPSGNSLKRREREFAK